MDVLPGERRQFPVGSLLRPSVGEPEPSRPMAGVQGVRTEHAGAATPTEPAWTEVIGNCRGRKKPGKKQQRTPHPRWKKAMICHVVPKLTARCGALPKRSRIG